MIYFVSFQFSFCFSLKVGGEIRSPFEEMWKYAECAIRKGSFQSMIYCILLRIGKFLSSPPLQDISVQLQDCQSCPPGMLATVQLNG